MEDARGWGGERVGLVWRTGGGYGRSYGAWREQGRANSGEMENGRLSTVV